MDEKKWNDTDAEHLKNWKATRDQKAGQALAKKFMPLVDYVVGRLSVSLPHSIQRDDLKGFGFQGLLDALDKFDMDRGLQFETYATFRIRGSIIDGLRQNDWVPRSVRDKTKKVEEAFTYLEQHSLRSVTDQEVSEYLGMSENEVNQVVLDASLSALLSIDEAVYDEDHQQVGRYNLIPNTHADDPQQSLHKKWVQEQLASAIGQLPEKEKIVVSLVYYEELSLTEIASILELSTSRISQLHSKAILRLKASISQKLEADQVHSVSY